MGTNKTLLELVVSEGELRVKTTNGIARNPRILTNVECVRFLDDRVCAISTHAPSNANAYMGYKDYDMTSGLAITDYRYTFVVYLQIDLEQKK